MPIYFIEKEVITMMYDFIRAVISVIILISAYFVFKIIRKKFPKKKITNNEKSRRLITGSKEKAVRKHFAGKILLVLFLYSIILFILVCIPFENLFVNFSSPEDVFKYTKQGKIDKIIYGENSCMIYYSAGDSNGITFARKEGSFYKIVPFNQYSINTMLSENSRFDHVYTENYSGDTYYSLTLFNKSYDNISELKDSITITDDFKTEFSLVRRDDYFWEFCAYVKDYNEDYTVNVEFK